MFTRSFVRVLPIVLLGLFFGAANPLNAQSIRWGRDRFPPNYPNSGWCNPRGIGLNLAAYAQEFAGTHGGDRNTAQVFLAANNVSGWRMKYYVRGSRQWVVRGIDMVDAARSQGQRNGYNRAPTFMENWGVYYTDYNNPYSWKGAYWLSGCY